MSGVRGDGGDSRRREGLHRRRNKEAGGRQDLLHTGRGPKEPPRPWSDRVDQLSAAVLELVVNFSQLQREQEREHLALGFCWTRSSREQASRWFKMSQISFRQKMLSTKCCCCCCCCCYPVLNVDPAETRSPNQSNFRKKYEPGSNKNYMVRKGSPNRSGTAHLHSSPLNTSRARAG